MFSNLNNSEIQSIVVYNDRIDTVTYIRIYTYKRRCAQPVAMILSDHQGADAGTAELQ